MLIIFGREFKRISPKFRSKPQLDFGNQVDFLGLILK